MPSTPTAANYFSDLSAKWNQIWITSEVRNRYFIVVGSAVIKLQFAGSLLSDLYLPAFGRALLKDIPSQWDAEISIWCSGANDDLTAPDWESVGRIGRGEMPSLSDKNIRSVYNIESSIFSSYCSESKIGFHCVRHSARLPQYEIGAPLRDILSWILSDRGEQLVHAAAVGNAAGGVLLVGKGGSGKSTTATHCIGTSLKFLSDDYCVLREIDGTWHVNSLFDTCKLYPEDVRVDSCLNECESTYSTLTGKRLFFINTGIEQHLCKSFPLTAIVLPRIEKDAAVETSWVSVSPSKAIRALAPSTLFQLPSAGVNSFKLMASVVRATPAFDLLLGSDRDKVNDALLELLD